MMPLSTHYRLASWVTLAVGMSAAFAGGGAAAIGVLVISVTFGVGASIMKRLDEM